MRRLLALLPAGLFAADFPAPYNSEPGEPMPAEEVAATMELPPGFKCVVFAAEPDVQQPIGMAWDSRGRLWVAECYTYAENPDRWDLNLRDRLVVFEDQDGDGRHDKRTVFWDQGSQLTSVETGYGGVWILNAGTLSFIPDQDGDDVPDGAPRVLLDGFNTKTIGHNIVNGLRWGPDGWLYGRHGITETSAVGVPGTPDDKRVKLNCAIWRYHPKNKSFEVVAHGGTNSWGHDWNADGELFMINTVIGHLWHVIPGAYYRRMFGAHLNPHVYEIIEQTADHFHWDTGAEKWSDIRHGISGKTLELGGGHAHVGMLIYQGGLWPKEYHGTVMTCNLHGRRINIDTLHREGCGYTGKHAPDFMQAKDPWFRGIELLSGPDGNVFVADWSDTGECHDNDGVHRTSGRIYKIVYGEPKKAEPVNIAKASDSDLFAVLMENKNNWWTRMAAKCLYEQNPRYPDSYMDASTHAIVMNSLEWQRLSSTVTAKEYENASGDPTLYEGRRRNNVISNVEQGGYDEPLKASFLTASELDRRLKALRGDPSQRDKNPLIESYYLDLYEAAFDTSGIVRLHLASALQRLPIKARWPIATALAKHEEDANDRQQPLMIWYGIEPAVTADPLKGVELIRESKIPTVRRLVARRIAEMIEDKPEALATLVALMAERSELRGDVLAGMAAGLEGFSSAEKPKGWDAFAASSNAAGKAHINSLSIVFGSGRAIEDLISIVQNVEGDANARLNAFKSLTRVAKPELLPVIRGQINDKVLAPAARSALAAYDDPSVPTALLKPWSARSQEQQAATIATLVSRVSYADALLEAVKAGRVPKAMITPYQARAIRSLDDAKLNTKLSAVWGELRDTPEAKKAELADWSTRFTAERLAKGDALQGKALFTAVCSACHKLYGEGGQLGPDLTGGDRHKLTYLLENIVDPNAIVPADYRMTVFKLKDGRTLTGVIPEQTERVITIQTQTEKLTVEKAQIVEQQQLPISLMPEGLLTALGEEQTAHLLAYLMSNSPP